MMLPEKRNILVVNTILRLLLLRWSYQQEITALKFADSYSTNCLSNLVQGKDKIVLHGQIDTLGHYDTLEYVQYELNSDGYEYELLCLLDLKECIGYEPKNCYCSTSIKENVFDVTINITALAYLSGAKIRGALKYIETSIHGDVTLFPNIYDPSTTKAYVWINNQDVDIDNCNVAVKSDYVLVVFIVLNTLNLPLRLSIQENGTEGGSNYHMYSYFTSIEKELSLWFEYEVCHLQEYRRNFTCNITKEHIPRDWEKVQEKDIWMIIFIGINLVLNILFAIILRWKTRKINRLKQMCQQIFNRVDNYGKHSNRTTTSILSTDTENETDTELEVLLDQSVRVSRLRKHPETSRNAPLPVQSFSTSEINFRHDGNPESVVKLHSEETLQPISNTGPICSTDMTIDPQTLHKDLKVTLKNQDFMRSACNLIVE
ncbi:uncharacterized protein LOC106058939 isoform X2 [Biomphalaria glabrata]|uniref:Uncharacterized protein LOC106058939 isoform X2 n=1 Tax=Biomphalaria glabrata TaxID=6526 RepID=A0A9W2YVC8_BIOGL|nr:uncharacterized protein LOC106058939 isoform X2 [Biomphalaria glabrata]